MIYMTARESFKQALAKYLKRAGMKQRDLAAAVGVSESTVHCWMSGKAFPRINMIEKIAEVLSCTPDDLLNYEEPVQSETRGMRLLDAFPGAARPLHPAVLEMLEPRKSQTPKEDAEMVVLWRNATLAAKRAAIAVLKSMEELK